MAHTELLEWQKQLGQSPTMHFLQHPHLVSCSFWGIRDQVKGLLGLSDDLQAANLCRANFCCIPHSRTFPAVTAWKQQWTQDAPDSGPTTGKKKKHSTPCCCAPSAHKASGLRTHVARGCCTVASDFLCPRDPTHTSGVEESTHTHTTHTLSTTCRCRFTPHPKHVPQSPRPEHTRGRTEPGRLSSFTDTWCAL